MTASRRHAIHHLQYALHHSAGELSTEELERVLVIVSNPRGYKIPDWFLNRQKDIKDGRYSQVTASALDTKLREDLERMKKIRYGVVHNVATATTCPLLPRAHRGLRHYWGMRVRGQHTKTTGHRGRTVGVGGKKK